MIRLGHILRNFLIYLNIDFAIQLFGATNIAAIMVV